MPCENKNSEVARSLTTWRKPEQSDFCQGVCSLLNVKSPHFTRGMNPLELRPRVQGWGDAHALHSASFAATLTLLHSATTLHRQLFKVICHETPQILNNTSTSKLCNSLYMPSKKLHKGTRHPYKPQNTYAHNMYAPHRRYSSRELDVADFTTLNLRSEILV